jgi:subtilisin family serine protease
MAAQRRRPVQKYVFLADEGLDVATRLPSIRTEQVASRIGSEAMLVSMSDDQRLSVLQENPDIQLVAEGRARMAFAGLHLTPIPASTMASVGSSKAIVVQVRDQKGKPVKGAPVALLTNLKTQPPTGAESKTDKRGSARFLLPSGNKVARIQVMPNAGFWWATHVPAKQQGKYLLECVPLDAAAPDGLRAFYAAGQPADGAGVTVAVIDGGIGPHPRLDLAGGANLVDDEPDDAILDNGIGHGTHVAGIIGARADARTPGGLAPAVKLLSYRVYAKGSTHAGSFAVAAAIRKAVDAGADLINLSLVLDEDQPEVNREIQRALAGGVVCIVAAGNSGGPVGQPARISSVLAVSAVAVRASWPKGALDADVLASPRAKKNKRLGFARFSNFGPQIDCAAPGVGIVSTVPRGKTGAIGMMRGTSMAAPAVTALIARALGQDAALLNAPRTKARAERILTLARSLGAKAGFGANYEGFGLLR